MRRKKLFGCGSLAAFCVAVLATVFLPSCMKLINQGDGESSLTITFPAIQQAGRAIAYDDLGRIREDTRSYRVIVEPSGGQRQEKTSSSPSFVFYFAPGKELTITVECLNSDGEVLVRTAPKKHTMTAGMNDISINLRQDGEAVLKVSYSYGEAAAAGAKGGLPSDGKEYKVAEVFTVPSTSPTWQHGTFDGWQASVEVVPEAGGAATTTPTAGSSYKMPSAGGVVLTAQWSRNQYAVTYDLNQAATGGTASASSIQSGTVPALSAYVVSSTTPASVTAGGKNYTFVNWSDGKGGSYNVGSTIAQVTEDITLTAQWSDKTAHTITYSIGNGPQQSAVQGWQDSSIYIEGSASVTMPALTAPGYTFVGWQDASSSAVTSPYAPSSNVTLTAKWTEKQYAITFDTAGGSAVSQINDFTVSYGGAFSNATKTGYTFQSWQIGGTQYTASTLKDAIKAGTVGGSAASITLTAAWTIIPYSITYNANNGSGTATGGDTSFNITTANVNLGSGTGLSRQGYTFAGWSNTSSGVNVGTPNAATLIGFATGSSTTITLYAVWEGELKSVPEVGDIIMSDGSLKKSTDTNIDTDDTIAIVYKAENGTAWAVGKVLSDTGLRLTSSTAAGAGTQITPLEDGNRDGSTALAKLKEFLRDAGNDDTDDLAANYPAWDYACNYGTKQNLTNFRTGWYLPTKTELEEICGKKDEIETGLASTGVAKSQFDSGGYWSVTETPSTNGGSNAYFRDPSGGNNSGFTGKSTNSFYVVAVRQFTY